jgi:hypothetical protein
LIWVFLMENLLPEVKLFASLEIKNDLKMRKAFVIQR